MRGEKMRHAILCSMLFLAKRKFPFFAIALLTWPGSGYAAYWNVFNQEGESSATAVIVTYNSRIDMLTAANPTGFFEPITGGALGANVVGSGSDGKTYWNVFNQEGESSATAVIVTYNSLIDMLTAANPTGFFEPITGGALGANVVGSGSDGKTYWNVFNQEGESSATAVIVTYSSLIDMLTAANPTGFFEPIAGGALGANVVDSGSDGQTYWNVFNQEGESSATAVIVTYSSLIDMLTAANPTGFFEPITGGALGANVVGSGAEIMGVAAVPEPGSLALLCTSLLGVSLLRGRRGRS